MPLESDIAQILGEETQAEAETSEVESSSEEKEVGEETETSSEEETSSKEETSESEETSSEETSKESSEEEGKSENELLKEQNQKLKEQLNQTSAKSPQAESSSSEESSSPSDPLADVDPLGDFEFNSLVEDSETFKKWAKNFGSKIYEKAKEDFYREVPQVVQSTTQEQIQLREKAKEFYENNSDLAEVKPFVAQTTNQVHSEHPDWDFDQVLEESAKRARDALGLEKQALQTEKASKKKDPALAKEGGSRKSGKRESKDQRSEMERDIDEMIKS